MELVSLAHGKSRQISCENSNSLLMIVFARCLCNTSRFRLYCMKYEANWKAKVVAKLQ